MSWTLVAVAAYFAFNGAATIYFFADPDGAETLSDGPQEDLQFAAFLFFLGFPLFFLVFLAFIGKRIRKLRA